MDIYLDDFISLIQGGTAESTQMLWYLLHTIDRVFRPNGPADANHKEPIPPNKLRKACSAKKCDNLLVEAYIFYRFRGILLCNAKRL